MEYSYLWKHYVDQVIRKFISENEIILFLLFFISMLVEVTLKQKRQQEKC